MRKANVEKGNEARTNREDPMAVREQMSGRKKKQKIKKLPKERKRYRTE